MPTSRLYRTKTQDCVFILWGERFEENTVATFVTELRDAGLCVKVVGLAGQRSTGKHGLILYSDLTLSDALALVDRAICVVVPCSSATIKRMENDPRVPIFFQKAHANHAQFVMSTVETFDQSSLKKLAVSDEALQFYGNSIDLTTFAREVADKLSSLMLNS